MKKLEKKLTCPRCGCKDAITPRIKIWMLGRGSEDCRVCGQSLCTPFWFDCLRIVGLICTAYLMTTYCPLFVHTNPTYLKGKSIGFYILLFIYIPYWFITGWISLHFISLHIHPEAWTGFYKWKSKARLTCPRCGCKDAITLFGKMNMYKWYSGRCPECSYALDNPWWFNLLRLCGIIYLAFTLYTTLMTQTTFLLNDFFVLALIPVFLIPYAYITGLIALYFMPNRARWGD